MLCPLNKKLILLWQDIENSPNTINLNLRSNFSRMFTFSSQYIAPLCQRIYGCVCGTFLPCVLEMFRKEILTGGWTHSLWWQWASNNYSRIFWCWKIPEMSNKHWNSIIGQLKFGAQLCQMSLHPLVWSMRALFHFNDSKFLSFLSPFKEHHLFQTQLMPI